MTRRSPSHPPVPRPRETAADAPEAEASAAPDRGEAVADYLHTDEIFARVVATADAEIDAPASRLCFSALAAGITITLCFVGRAVLTGALPDAPVAVQSLFYPIGFVAVVLGRYQLFTENTLTPVTLLLVRCTTLPAMLRVWGLVLVFNLVGAGLAAVGYAWTPMFDPPTVEAALGMGRHAISMSGEALFVRGVLAGSMVAGLVWLVHAAREAVARVVLTYLIMLLVPTAGLFHCITDTADVVFTLALGEASWWDLGAFFVPVALGNTVGGVCLVALINYGQVDHTRMTERTPHPWPVWLLGEWLGGRLIRR